jgi:DNA repair/transcription protein MET18/MMS19
MQPLYKQRLFAQVKPHILAGYQVAEETKSLYLTAFSSVLRHIPHQVFVAEIKTVCRLLDPPFFPPKKCALTPLLFFFLPFFLTSKALPLLLQSLAFPEPALKESSLELLSTLIHDSKDSFKDHISSFVPILLGLSKREQSNSVSVRVNALRILGSLSALPYTTIHPHKTTVARELLVSLDDHKRAVRKEAVDCRTKWFLASDSQSS